MWLHRKVSKTGNTSTALQAPQFTEWSTKKRNHLPLAPPGAAESLIWRNTSISPAYLQDYDIAINTYAFSFLSSCTSRLCSCWLIYTYNSKKNNFITLLLIMSDGASTKGLLALWERKSKINCFCQREREHFSIHKDVEHVIFTAGYQHILHSASLLSMAQMMGIWPEGEAFLATSSSTDSIKFMLKRELTRTHAILLVFRSGTTPYSNDLTGKLKYLCLITLRSGANTLFPNDLFREIWKNSACMEEKRKTDS